MAQEVGEEEHLSAATRQWSSKHGEWKFLPNQISEMQGKVMFLLQTQI